MQHAKFQDHRTSGSGEETFIKVFTINGHGGHLGHVTWTIYINEAHLIPSSVYAFQCSSKSSHRCSAQCNTLSDPQKN